MLKLSSFSGKKTAHTPPGQTETTVTALNSWPIIQSIHKLPFCDYLSLTLDNDLSVLNPNNDEVPVDVLEAAKEDLQEQFNEAIAGSEFTEYLQTAWSVESLTAKAQRLTDNLITFFECPCQEYIDMFIADGLDYDPSDLQEYVKCIRNEIVSIEVQIKRRHEIFDKMGGDENKQPDREYYSILMADIRKSEGWNVPYSIMTFDYCVYYNRLKQYYERLKKENGSRAA